MIDVVAERSPGFMDSLPGDVVADVLALLPPRSLAVARCVCKAWLAIVDAGHHLRADLLPLTVGGVFTDMLHELVDSQFLRRPSTGPKLSGDLGYVDVGSHYGITLRRVVDCCNGLLLVNGTCVVNPATRRWARLPPCPAAAASPERMHGFSGYRAMRLVFDPTMSPHYQVVWLPNLFSNKEEIKARFGEGLVEWPPSPWMMHVFSSRTQRWEERSIVREEGEAIAIADLKSRLQSYYYAAYWNEALYIHFLDDFLVRVTLSDGKYQVIKTPASIDAVTYGQLRIGKSKNGVYCALTCEYQLCVWFLREIGCSTEWILMHENNLYGSLATHVSQNIDPCVNGAWILQGYYKNKDRIGEGELEWDFNTDNVLDIDIQDMDDKKCNDYVPILGLHPYKEIVFLQLYDYAVVAYHWDGYKVQYMSNKLWSGCYDESVESYFIYTPCWTGDLSERELT